MPFVIGGLASTLDPVVDRRPPGGSRPENRECCAAMPDGRTAPPLADPFHAPQSVADPGPVPQTPGTRRCTHGTEPACQRARSGFGDACRTSGSSCEIESPFASIPILRNRSVTEKLERDYRDFKPLCQYLSAIFSPCGLFWGFYPQIHQAAGPDLSRPRVMLRQAWTDLRCNASIAELQKGVREWVRMSPLRS
jgi:hypothetical protein